MRLGLSALLFCIVVPSCVTASMKGDQDLHVAPGATADPDTLLACVLDADTLAMVAVLVDSVTKDTLMPDGTAFRVAHPVRTPPYARGANWFPREIIEVNGGTYVPYGGERHIPREHLARAGNYRGLPLFVEAGQTESPPQAIFFAAGPGCIFQPFQGTSF